MYLRHLYPAPKSFWEDESVRFVFGAKVNARVSGLTPDCAERVKTLWRRFSCDASALDFVPDDDGFRFTIGDAAAMLREGDAYALRVDASGVSVVGTDGHSLLLGIETLVQLICPENLAEGEEAFYLSAAEAHDSPAIPFRAVHFCLFPDTKLYNIEKAIHLAGFLKMTHIVLEFWGTFPYACEPALAWRDRAFSRSELKDLVSLANSYGMEVIPMSNQFGHATQARVGFGRHVILNRDPRLSRLFEPDGWTWCLSNPDTYRLLGEMRAELIDLCGKGSYFHLGFDEAYSFATCDRCRRRVPHELLAEFLNRLTEDVCAEGRRPIVWHDQFLRRSDFGEGPIVANGDNRNTAAALDLLDKRIILADWQYDYRGGFNVTTSVLMAKGFDTVVCPWDNRENIRSLAADAKKLGAYGILLTTWDHLPNWLRDASFAAGCVWGEGEENPPYSITESACLLRRLYDTDGSFEESGWNRNEVWQ
ncbi:MAG: beta-N-acetylhexosaminidase [Clostridiales bacterium]|nr:beta-N-acetylhexosaminidase [Clostridiales bacterium]